MKIGEDENTELGDLLRDTSIRSPEEATLEGDLSNEVTRALAPLSDREKEVLRLRYGLGTDREYTLEEIGRRLSVTRERGMPNREPRPAEGSRGEKRRVAGAQACVRTVRGFAVRTQANLATRRTPNRVTPRHRQLGATIRMVFTCMMPVRSAVVPLSVASGTASGRVASCTPGVVLSRGVSVAGTSDWPAVAVRSFGGRASWSCRSSRGRPSSRYRASRLPRCACRDTARTPYRACQSAVRDTVGGNRRLAAIGGVPHNAPANSVVCDSAHRCWVTAAAIGLCGSVLRGLRCGRLR